MNRKQMRCEQTHGFHVVELKAQTNYKLHTARFWCITCNKYLAWASKDQFRHYKKKQLVSVQLTPFLDDFQTNGIKSPPFIFIPKGEKRIDLSIEYKDKMIAKNHGCFWDPFNKTWFTHTGNTQIEHLLGYMSTETLDEVYEWLSTYGNRNPYYLK